MDITTIKLSEAQCRIITGAFLTYLQDGIHDLRTRLGDLPRELQTTCALETSRYWEGVGKTLDWIKTRNSAKAWSEIRKHYESIQGNSLKVRKKVTKNEHDTTKDKGTIIGTNTKFDFKVLE